MYIHAINNNNNKVGEALQGCNELCEGQAFFCHS